MARKSSKTAHVMNLLAGDDPESSKSEAAKENFAARQTSDSTETIKELTVLAQQASIQTQEGPLSPSPISIIDMTSSAPDPVAELIKQQLEEEEAGNEAILQESFIPEDAVKEETSPVSEIQPEDEPAIVQESESSFQYLNVMEHIVKNRAEEYMEKFNVCNCGHCTADVTALALSHLPPKYIVVEPPSASPLLNYYSNRFSQQVVVELTKACSIVKENPHH
ncbi:late competence development ComFB family protein [Clostridium sp. Marseille-P2415]|uniref:late competence development ComFB family protein n=1 Tax=Clostridium sp. Marseille-P2415 TaxID=1805471 RepID=UPI00098860EF|nr:late competence development ComFB family protein [Clostridium sp. Marseille-P2415]